MPKRKGVIEPIDAPFDEVVDSIVEWPQDKPFHIKNMPREEIDKLPFAKWRGKIALGSNELDCYVLDDGQRMLSSSSTTKAYCRYRSAAACRIT